MTNQRFAFREAQTVAERLAHYRLRYAVYVEEMHSVLPTDLAPTDREDKLERDWYDQYATPFISVDTSTGACVGTARLIPETPRGFLMEERFPLPTAIHRAHTMELSRFLIRQDYRQGAAGYDRHDLGIGLYRWSRAHGITTWCAALQVWLLYMFLGDGVSFRIIGPVARDYHHTAVVPVILDDVEAFVRRLWTLNPPLHLRYTGGMVIPPRAADEVERVKARMAQDRATLRSRCKARYDAVQPAMR